MAAFLLLPLASLPHKVAAAPTPSTQLGWAFDNYYRIDNTFQAAGTYGNNYATTTESYLLTQTANGPQWVNSDQTSTTSPYCDRYVYLNNSGGGATQFYLHTQTRVQGSCNPGSGISNVTDTPITVDTSKEKLVLFTAADGTITTIDTQHVWSPSTSSNLKSYPGIQGVWFENSNPGGQIGSTNCPSMIIETNSKYLFSAPYEKNGGTVQNDPASSYYQNMVNSLLGSGNYSSCYADGSHGSNTTYVNLDVYHNNLNALANIPETTTSFWSSGGTPAASYQQLVNSLVDISGFVGTSADLNNNIATANASSTVKSRASNSQNPSTPPQSDGCPLPMDASMRWLGCSVFAALSDAAKALAKQINDFLYIDPNVLFTGNAQAAANIFRNIGMVLIVIAGLFMIISQALGFEFLDAYTIRKLMPRLGVALVGMALAWPLLRLVVILTNDLGGLINSIFMSVAAQANSGSSTRLDLGTFLGANLIGLGVATAVAVLLGVAGFLSLLGTVILGLLIGLFVLAIRQLVIFMAVILAPLAIAAYVLPGGQKLWGFWKNTLLTALFMYPLIMGFISAGAAMAYIMPKDGNTMQILAIIVYFAPYFMLPFAFKLAGGLMGSIFSMAHERNKGIFEKQRKKREAIREDRLKRAEAGKLWDPSSRLQKALHANTWASMLADPGGNLAHAGRNIPGLRKKGSAIESSINAQRVQQTGKLFEELNNMFGNNDKAYRLLSGAHNGFSGKDINGVSTQQKLKAAGLYGKRLTSLNDFQTAAQILSESEDGAERLAGNAVHNASGRLATLNRDPEMMRADVTAAGMMGLAAHGFATGDDLAYTGNLLQESGLSAGAAQSLVVQAQVMGARGRPDLKAGYGIVYNGQTGRFENGLHAEGNQTRAADLVMSLSSSDLAQAKGGAFEALAPTIQEIINTGGQRGIAVQNQVFSWASQYSQASADIIAQARQFIIDGGPSMEAAFANYNREYDPERVRGGTPNAPEPPQPPAGPGGGAGGGSH